MGLRATFLTGGVHSVVIEREDGGVGVQVNYTDFPAHTGVVGCMDTCMRRRGTYRGCGARGDRRPGCM